MTNQQMIDNIKDNLGNRATGRIGSRAVDTVVLDALNVAVPNCVLEAQPDYYNRTATLALVVGTREYALPVVDSDGDTIRVKDIYSHRCARASGTEVILKHVNYAAFVQAVPDFSLETTGTPRLFALWGKTNTLYLDYLPSEALTLSLFVEVYPNLITTGQLTEPMLIDPQWELAVEAYATAYCFLKMQQEGMYDTWTKMYQAQKPQVTRTENHKHGAGIAAGSPYPQSISDPLTNPLVRSWN